MGVVLKYVHKFFNFFLQKVKPNSTPLDLGQDLGPYFE